MLPNCQINHSESPANLLKVCAPGRNNLGIFWAPRRHTNHFCYGKIYLDLLPRLQQKIKSWVFGWFVSIFSVVLGFFGVFLGGLFLFGFFR